MERSRSDMKCLLVVLCLWAVVEADTCLRKPHPSVTRHPKSSGDNGFKIIINGDPDRYVPGEFYAITLVGARTHNQLQTFTRFSIGAEPRDPNAQSSPLTHGQFQLFADTMSTFDEDCVNVVKEANDLPKTEVQVQWMAPKVGSGCVQIKAMVFENPRVWFAEDGQLTRLICEQPKKEVVVSNDGCCALDEAKYNMVFEGLWSNATHPKDFPFSLWLTHFSDVIGASHVKNFSFWGEGKIASDGFRSLAEWGSVRLMEQELKQQKKHLKTIIKAPGLWYPNVNTNTTSTFRVDSEKHLVSLASMLGPTPDWVVGVDGLDLCLKNCNWVENLVMDLYLYDAGTDSGITYMSPNSETKPREKMFRITTKYPEDGRTPFYDPYKDEMNPFARLYLFRDKIIPKNYDEKTLQQLTLSVSENTDDVENPACAVSEYSQWTPCSVTCGKGLRMRTREYIMPEQKVKMFNCNRQLVSREMCVADVPECEEDAAGENEDQEIDQDTEDTGICATSDWDDWSACSATCGIGYKERRRYFINHMGRKKCPQISTVEQEKCMMPECRPEDIEIPDPDCPVTPWSDWSQCSTSCGQGMRLRMRMLLVGQDLKEECSQRVLLTEQASCTIRPSCQLDMATAKSVCMEPINAGLCKGSIERWAFNTDKAMCVPFVYNGCKGNRNNFLSEQDCSNTCGIVRDALLGNPPAENVRQEQNVDEFSSQTYRGRIPQGVQSPRLASQNFQAENQDLNLRQDCMVSDWSEWTQCSAECGRGFMSSNRIIKVRERNGGKACPRKLSKRKGCFLRNC